MNSRSYGSTFCPVSDLVTTLAADADALQPLADIDMAKGYDLELNISDAEVLTYLHFQSRNEHHVLHRKPTPIAFNAPFYLLDLPVSSESVLRVKCNGNTDALNCLHVEAFDENEESIFQRSAADNKNNAMTCACLLSLQTDYAMITLETNDGELKFLCQAVDGMRVGGESTIKHVEKIGKHLAHIQSAGPTRFGASILSLPGKRPAEAERLPHDQVFALAIDGDRALTTALQISQQLTNLTPADSFGFYGALNEDRKNVFDTQASTAPVVDSDKLARLQAAVGIVNTSYNTLRACAASDCSPVVQEFHDVYQQFTKDVSWDGVPAQDNNLANVVNVRAKSVVLAAIEDLACIRRGVSLRSYDSLSKLYQLGQIFANNSANSVQLAQDVFSTCNDHLRKVDEARKKSVELAGSSADTARLTALFHPLFKTLAAAALVRGELPTSFNAKCKHIPPPEYTTVLAALPPVVSKSQRQALTDLLDMLHVDCKHRIVSQEIFARCVDQIKTIVHSLDKSSDIDNSEASTQIAISLGKLFDNSRYNLVQTALMGVVLDDQSTCFVASSNDDMIRGSRHLAFTSPRGDDNFATGYNITERTAQQLQLLRMRDF